MDGMRRRIGRFSPHFFAGLLFAITVCASGCQTASSFTLHDRTWKREKTELTSYERVDLVYEVNQSESGLKKRTRNWPDALTVSDEKEGDDLLVSQASNASPMTAWSKSRIHVIYPHPDGTPDAAQVTLRLSRLAPNEIETSYAGAFKRMVNRRVNQSKAWFGRDVEQEEEVASSRRQSQLDDEIWTTTLSKEQLDLLLGELTNNGFFGQQERPYACSELSLKVDHESICKTWTQEPRLNQLIEQTYQQGELVGFISPEEYEPLTTRKDRMMARLEKLPFRGGSDSSEEGAVEVEQVAFEE